ncbi:MAG: histidine kinase dimerization/phospho-acceptor domain-containing protein, partial [Holdemania massiliensis]
RANAEKFEVPAFYVANDGEAWQRYNPVITDYAIEPLASPGFLSPKRRLLYDAMSVCTILMPLLYAIAGILLCSRIFYQKRLAGPLAVLTEGAQKIADKDLDFAMTCRQPDELGQLCLSFEKMRAELLESQRAVWAVMEERRQLNASVAHDLRTPITIIEGYTEYLQRNLKNGRVDEAKLSSILDNLSASATRLERYVNCVRDIQAWMICGRTKRNTRPAVCLGDSGEFHGLQKRREKFVLMPRFPTRKSFIWIDSCFSEFRKMVSNACAMHKMR